MSKLRCPYCNTQGIKNIDIHKAGFFAIIHCKSCGAIHGVIPLPNSSTKKTEQTKPKNKDKIQKAINPHQATVTPQPKILKESKGPPTDFQHIALTDTILLRITSDVIGKKAALTAQQLQHMYRNSKKDSLTPICPHHHTSLLRLTITHEIRYGQDIWACPKYNQCEHWELAD